MDLKLSVKPSKIHSGSKDLTVSAAVLKKERKKEVQCAMKSAAASAQLFWIGSYTLSSSCFLRCLRSLISTYAIKPKNAQRGSRMITLGSQNNQGFAMTKIPAYCAPSHPAKNDKVNPSSAQYRRCLMM